MSCHPVPLTAFQLQEDLHAAELRISEQQDEISRLRSELDSRPLNAEKRTVELQDEVSGLKMIAGEFSRHSIGSELTCGNSADYERHLREPSRKVREDVEREWSVKLSKLEDQLESKRIWANRLDENVRAVTAENKELQTVRPVPFRHQSQADRGG